MSIYRGSSIVQDGLLLYLDAGNVKSYPKTGAVIKNLVNPIVSSVLNTVNPTPFLLTDFSVYNELSPSSVHVINSATYGYLGFTLLNKKVINWTTWEVSLKLSVISGSVSLYMGSSNAGYQEGNTVTYSVGEYNIENLIFYVNGTYSHEANNLQFGLRSIGVGCECRVVDLVVRERLYDGILVNSPTYNSSNNGNIVLDGIDDQIIIGHKSTITSSLLYGFTINVWIKINTAINSRYFLNKGENPAAFFLDPYYYFYFRDRDTSGYIGRRMPKGEIENQGIVMFSVTWDGIYNSNNIIMYKNGVVLSTVAYGSGSYTIPRQNTNFINFLEDLSGNFYIAQYYSRALSSVELLQNHNAIKTRFI